MAAVFMVDVVPGIYSLLLAVGGEVSELEKSMMVSGDFIVMVVALLKCRSCEALAKKN